MGSNRVRPALTFQNRGVRKPVAQIGEVQRCGHQHDRKVGPQQWDGVPQQGECEVSVPTSFVKFIEDHAADAIERWVSLQSAQKQPIGDHLHHGGFRAPLLSSNGIANALANGFTKRFGQASCGCLGGQTPGLDHPDSPWCSFHEGQGDPGCLSCSWRRLQEHGLAWSDLSAQLGQQGIDRVVNQAEV